MPNENLTSINVLLDRSGSMSSIRDDVIGGFNAFLKDQQVDAAGEATVSLVQFDNEYEENYLHVPLSAAEPLTDKTYVPRGGTALLDAMGRYITDLGAKFRSLPDEERPGRVIICVFTDGRENASYEYNRQRIADMVKEQEGTYNWVFTFLGANIDAFAAAGDMGFKTANAAQYTSSKRGMRSGYAAVSASIKGARGMSYGSFVTEGELPQLNRTIGEDEAEGTPFAENYDAAQQTGVDLVAAADANNKETTA
jgi:hypothetical protein